MVIAEEKSEEIEKLVEEAVSLLKKGTSINSGTEGGAYIAGQKSAKYSEAAVLILLALYGQNKTIIAQNKTIIQYDDDITELLRRIRDLP
jgi:hypothetical protein